jgi:ABC-type branched-subunit amino acid transport system ATPase component
MAKALRRLAIISGRVAPALLMVVLITLLMIVPTILVPQIMSRYGEHLSGLIGVTAITAVFGLLVAMLVQTGLLALQGTLSMRIATKVSVRLGAAIVHQLLRLPASFHLQRGASSVAQRASLIDSTSSGVSALALTMTAGLITSLIAMVILLIAEPITGLVAIGVALGTGVIVHRTALRAQHEAARTITEKVAVGAATAAVLAQFDSIKASGWEDGMIARVVATHNQLLEADQDFGILRLRLGLLPPALTGIGMIGITGVTMLEVVLGQLPPGSVLAVIALTAILIAPVGQIVDALDQFHLLEASLDQIDEIMEADLEDDYANNGSPAAPASLRGDLLLNDVTFGYNELANPVIKNLTLHLEPGGRVALVGRSGCGKSTIARLVAGLYRPWSGNILIDGLPRSQHAPFVLTDGLALVDQDVAIFAGTIRENVTLWDHTIPDIDVLAALADAQLAEDVAARPGGLDALLSEGGSDLSGGQQQRLEIARALVRRPALLVMDEATTALDPQTERLVDEAIRRRGIACLVVAHRLSTIRDSDQILVLDEGAVVESGTHGELAVEGSLYLRVVESG